MHEGSALKELEKKFRENKLAHAFLLETNDMDLCLQNLLTFFKIINCPSNYRDECNECNLCHLFDSMNLPSYVVIEPDGTTIKKEQILSLKQFFQTKPVYSKYNMYVVKNAECLNSSSANTMLKFIEEPEDYILGFFITNNKENIIDTIRSRCQILKDYYNLSVESNIPSVWSGIAINYLKTINDNKLDGILYNKDVVLPLIHDRKELFYLFSSILNIYYDCYQKVLNNEDVVNEELRFLKNKDKIFFQKQINLVTKLLDRMNYNLNISLMLDCFVLEGSDI